MKGISREVSPESSYVLLPINEKGGKNIRSPMWIRFFTDDDTCCKGFEVLRVSNRWMVSFPSFAIHRFPFKADRKSGMHGAHNTPLMKIPVVE
jgi:hypothetical protein